MSKVLFICHTFNMLFAAIQIRRFNLKNDTVDIVLTDYSNGMKEIAINLKDLKLFSNVKYAEVKNKYHGGNLLKKMRKAFYIFDSESTLTNALKLDSLLYDKVFFCNYDIISCNLYLILNRKHYDVEFHRFEEGYSTYTIEDNYVILHEFMKICCCLLGIKTLNAATKFIHLFEPSFLIYKSKYKVIPIKKIDISDSDTKEIINFVFGYSNQAKEYEDYEYIFFEECFSVDNKVDSDYEIIKRISNIVGKDKIIVKLHPRNQKNRFENDGINVAKSYIPWEVIMMNANFSKTIFITISSGAILPVKTWFNSKNKIVLLFNCCNNVPHIADDNYREYLRRLLCKYGEESILIPNNINELKQLVCQKIEG